MRLFAPKSLQRLRLALALAALTVLAVGQAQAQMRPLTEGDSPALLRASASVLRIISFANPGRVAPRKVATERLPRLELAALVYPLPAAERVAFQGEVCRLNGLAFCPVFSEEARGTAFSVGEAGQFMTCRHVFQDWFYWAWRFNPEMAGFGALVPPFALANAANRLLFVSASPPALRFAKTAFAHHADLERPLNSLLESPMFWDADFVTFRLPDALGVRPLARRTSFEPGEAVTLLGFAETSAPGHPPMVASAGKVKEREEIGMVTSAASAKGMSGAPMLDSAGRAGAMACAIGRKVGGGTRPALGLPIDPGELARELGAKYGVSVETDRR